jgi:SAM-dependent methyltransferase
MESHYERWSNIMSRLTDIYDEEYYGKQSAGSYHSALVVLPVIFEQLGRPASILDIGCGPGTWLKAARELLGAVQVLGVDHPRVHGSSSRLAISDKDFIGCDLVQPLELGRKFDLVLSLEVAEHLEPKFADRFVENLVHHSDSVVFSAAIPGQGGRYHVNERFPHYWVDRFNAVGFTCYDTLRPKLWLRSDVEFWYQQNILIFSRTRSERLSGLTSYRGEPLVHPHLIKQRMNRSLLQLTKLMRRSFLKAIGIPKYRNMHIEYW